MKVVRKVYTCLLVLIAVTACTNASTNKSEVRKANQAIATPLIQAIKHYQSDHKQLPATLTALVPSYLSELPKTTTGSKFDYRLDVSYEFTVCFYDDYDCCYQHTFQDWDCTGQAPEN